MFQDDLLFPHLTVAENLRYGYRLLAPGDRRFEVGRVVDLLGLAPLLDRRPGRLSGGERQRVALGRALAFRPSVLLSAGGGGGLSADQVRAFPKDAW